MRPLADPTRQPVRGAAIHSVPTGLPLPNLVAHVGDEEVFFVSTKIDNRGRLADRSAVRELGWRPEAQVSFSANRGALIVVSGCGHYGITRQGYLRLPAEVRHRCRVAAGDRLLVVIPPERDRLLIFTAATVTAAVSQAHEAMRRSGL